MPGQRTTFEYQRTQRFIAQIAEGVESLGEAELERLGARDTVSAFRSITFVADFPALMRAAYAARLPNRLLAPLARFDCRSNEALHRGVENIPWEEILLPGMRFAVFANVSQSALRHSRYAALLCKDGVVDRLMKLRGFRPDIETRNPDCWIHLHLHRDQATVSLDVSGGAMHRRGYRIAGVEAPMLETVAAAIIAMTEWDGGRPLVDPMCGSGTLVGEAHMVACRIPAGFLRSDFGFRHLPEYREQAWSEVKNELDGKLLPPETGLVSGADIDPDAIAASRANLARLPGGNKIELSVRSLFDHPLRDSVIVCNPPYGVRLSGTDIAGFYKRFGDFLKFSCAGSTAYVYFGERELLKSIGLRPSWKRPLRNGGLDGRLARFELY